MTTNKKEDTCVGKDCPMYNGRKKLKCQFLQISTWRTVNNEIYQTKDCAPIRAMSLASDTYNIVLNLQKAHEEERNSYNNLNKKVSTLVGKEPDVAMVEVDGNNVRLLSMKEIN
jgi:hypothetical protein